MIQTTRKPTRFNVALVFSGDFKISVVNAVEITGLELN